MSWSFIRTSDDKDFISELGILNNYKSDFEQHKDFPRLSIMHEELLKKPTGTPLYHMLAKECYQLRCSIMSELFGPKRALFTTLGTSSIQKLPDFHWNAEVMLVDEAAQCTEPSTWVPVLTTPKCKKLVLVGDQKQLPAIVLSDK